MNRKAVSPVIAVLLMIAIAVAAAILVYVWSMGLIGTLQTGGGQQVREQIEMDAYNWQTPGTLTLYLRNVGAADVVIDEVYISGEQATVTPVNLLVMGGASQVAVTEPTATYTSGVAYTIKVITITGGVFSFSCIYGGAS
jgi:flagellin-like protein